MCKKQLPAPHQNVSIRDLIIEPNLSSKNVSIRDLIIGLLIVRIVFFRLPLIFLYFLQ
jgi:hypothetical protein